MNNEETGNNQQPIVTILDKESQSTSSVPKDSVESNASIVSKTSEVTDTSTIRETKKVANKATEAPTLKQIIAETREEEAPASKTFTLRKILGGDILTTATVKKTNMAFVAYYSIYHYLHFKQVQCTAKPNKDR